MIQILKYGEVANEDIFARVTPTVNVEAIVTDIIATVRRDGDRALYAYCEKFDGAKLSSLAVTKEEIDEAMTQVEPKFIEILEKAAKNIPGIIRVDALIQYVPSIPSGKSAYIIMKNLL